MALQELPSLGKFGTVTIRSFPYGQEFLIPLSRQILVTQSFCSTRQA
jgi:hypothetical protein